MTYNPWKYHRKCSDKPAKQFLQTLYKNIGFYFEKLGNDNVNQPNIFSC